MASRGPSRVVCLPRKKQIKEKGEAEVWAHGELDSTRPFWKLKALCRQAVGGVPHASALKNCLSRTLGILDWKCIISFHSKYLPYNKQASSPGMTKFACQCTHCSNIRGWAVSSVLTSTKHQRCWRITDSLGPTSWTWYWRDCLRQADVWRNSEHVMGTLERCQSCEEKRFGFKFF